MWIMDVLRGLMKFTDHPVVGGGGRAHSGQCLPSQLLVVMKCITLHHIIIQPPASTSAGLLLQLLVARTSVVSLALKLSKTDRTL